VRGLVLGLGGALGLVLPYLVPFVVGMTILEDVGYLPRVGYLVDGLMHRIASKSAIPLIRVRMQRARDHATRILDSRRDRIAPLSSPRASPAPR
jgi:ferrous iron transport protein B